MVHVSTGMILTDRTLKLKHNKRKIWNKRGGQNRVRNGAGEVGRKGKRKTGDPRLFGRQE